MPTKMPNVIEHDAIITEDPDRMKVKVWLQVQHLVNETFRHLHEAASARGLLNSYSILRGPYHFYITLDDEDGLVISFSVRFKHEPQRIYAQDIRKHSIRGIGTSNVGNDSLEEHVKMPNAKFIRFRPWEFEADKKFREYAKVRVEEFLSMLELSDSQNSPTKDEKDSEKWYQTNTFKFVVIPLVVALFLGIPAWFSLGNKTDHSPTASTSIFADVSKDGSILRSNNFPWDIEKTKDKDGNILYTIVDRRGDATAVSVVPDNPKYTVYQSFGGMVIKFTCSEEEISSFTIKLKY